MSVQVYTPRIKPIQWDVQRGRVAPEYRRFHDGLAQAYLFWQKSGVPRDLISHGAMTDLTGTSWTTTRMGPALSFDGAEGTAPTLPTEFQLGSRNSVFLLAHSDGGPASGKYHSLFGRAADGDNYFAQHRVGGTRTWNMQDNGNNNLEWPSSLAEITDDFFTLGLTNDGTNWELFYNGISKGTLSYSTYLRVTSLGDAHTSTNVLAWSSTGSSGAPESTATA